ncbi:hypothetical protein [Brevibacterium casei]|uniref:Uncharacterized protein n=1 Tax=Brevibacterium casei TaxID=33889 RepID=A0A7T4A1M4_9MICO|nr:hypothetical protein [Brevibacterium casei]QQB15663.1 hypothetical protein I6H47_06990 [Brevibacterium casei]
MSSELSPVLRLIPYLLAITAIVVVGIPVGRDVDWVFRILIGAVAYFATFYLSRFVIERLASRGNSLGEDDDDTPTGT